MPSVGALIVAYNHAAYIEEAIASVLAQSVRVSEIVVVDDGSSDETIARVRGFDDERIRVLTGPHRGISRLSETYNRGLSACRADVVGIIEGDDRWPPEKLRLQLPHFSDPAVVLSHGAYSVVGARGATLIEHADGQVLLPEGPYDAFPLHLVRSYILSITVLVRRVVLQAQGGFSQLGETPHWDYPTFLRLAERARFAHTGAVVGIWRKHGASGTMALAGRDLQGADLSRDLALAARRRSGGRIDLPGESEIDRAWSNAFATQIWQMGRVLLLRGEFPRVRELARQGLRRRVSGAMRARLLLMYLAALGRFDLERLRLWGVNRSPLKELV